jgi:hypothetical protein
LFSHGQGVRAYTGVSIVDFAVPPTATAEELEAPEELAEVEEEVLASFNYLRRLKRRMRNPRNPKLHCARLPRLWGGS